MGVTLQAMAGYHLTRNRVLFFSGSLFILLAVSVHVFPFFHTPYFNSSTLPEEQASAQVTPTAFLNVTLRDYCISNIHKVEFSEIDKPQLDEQISNQTDWDHFEWRWQHEALHQCKYQKLDREDALELLQGTWIVIAGDSQARLLFVALMELILPSIEDLRPYLFKRHSNFEYNLESHHILMEFAWAPYTTNLTRMAKGYRQDQKRPDIIVSGVGLWHMLHSGNYTQYGKSLVKLKQELGFLLNDPISATSEEALTVQLFWMNLPTLAPSLYQSDLKRERMTTQQSQLYTMEVLRSEIAGTGGLTTLLDIQTLSHECGTRCTRDGIHYSQAVYRAALHIIINNLLITTKQTPIP